MFLERESYRRRRLMDAARILPVIGLVLFLLPALWRGEGEPNTAAEAQYLFLTWALLILTAALLARPLRRSDAAQPPQPPAASNTDAADVGASTERRPAAPGPDRPPADQGP